MYVKALVLFLVGASGITVAQGGCIAGNIVDDSGSPLVEMRVAVSDPTHDFYRSLRTDEYGHFLLKGLPAGNYDIVTRNEELGYPDSNDRDFSNTSGRLFVAVTESQDCSPVTIRREPRAGTVRLKITDDSTGEIIRNPEANFRRTDGFHGWNEISLHGLDLLVPSWKPLECALELKDMSLPRF